MNPVIPAAEFRNTILRQLQASTTQNPLHQHFQTGMLGSGFPANSDPIVQLQQMLLTTLLMPMLQSMMDSTMGPSMPFAPPVGGNPQPTSPFPQPTIGPAPLPTGSPAGPIPGAPTAPVGGYGGGQNPGLPAPGAPAPGYGPAPVSPAPGAPAPGYGPAPVSPAPGGPAPGYGNGESPAVGGEIPVDMDYRDLSIEERREVSGMSDRDRAVLHLWGIQMTSQGFQDGGVLHNVLENPSSFTAAEVELAQELVARDQQSFGGVTGRALDEEFFALYEGLTGNDISGRYANAPVQFAQGPINMDNRLNGNNGLSGFENQVLQLWGHDPLFDGQIDGNIIDYALNSEHALEANLNRADLEALREADLASDGVLNGDSLENAFLQTLDNLYLGGPTATVERTMNDALAEAALRRDGVLPPPDPAYDTSAPVDALAPDHSNMVGGGACPFLA